MQGRRSSQPEELQHPVTGIVHNVAYCLGTDCTQWFTKLANCYDSRTHVNGNFTEQYSTMESTPMRTPTGTLRTMLMTTAAFTLLLSTVVLAQPRPPKPDPKHQAARQQLRQTMLDWARTAILPTLTTWKNQLDAAMSPEDLTALNALRARAATLRKEAISHLNSLRQAWQSEDYDALKRHRDALKGMREQRDELFSELKPLAIKYRGTLQQIGEVARPQVRQWRQEGKKKVEEWMTAHKDELGDRPFAMHGMPWKGWGKMLGLGGEMQKKAAVARFMLWNGEDITQDLQKIAPTNESINEGFDLK